MGTLNHLFQLVFPSPEYFLFTIAILIVLVGLIAGLTGSAKLNELGVPSSKDRESAEKPWWEQEEQHYDEWNEYQVRERHRIASQETRQKS